jgi:hypothetical protein
VIHHIGPLVSYYQEARRVLKEGGRVCTVTHSEALLRSSTVLSRYFPEAVELLVADYPPIDALRRRGHEVAAQRAYISGAPRRHASFERYERHLTQRKPERQHSAGGYGSECRPWAKFQTSFHRVQQSNEGEASCR